MKVRPKALPSAAMKWRPEERLSFEMFENYPH